MNTTNLFVELVVIGISAAFWVLLLVFTVFGYGWLSIEELFTWPALVPGLAVVYALGIVVDRFADNFFERRALPLSARWFKSEEEYQHARMFIYTRSDALRDLFEYGRSRIRICRGWAFNSFMSAIALNLFVWVQMPADDVRWKLSVFGSFFFLLFGVAAWRAWLRLVSNEYKRLHEQYIHLSNPKKKR